MDFLITSLNSPCLYLIDLRDTYFLPHHGSKLMQHKNRAKRLLADALSRRVTAV